MEHLQSLFDDINVRASHAELRALAAVLSATEGDHFTTSDTTASRLLELANEPHLHGWSSEEWHVALKEERKKLSDTAREAEYQHLLQKESIKLHRLANVKKKVNSCYSCILQGQTSNKMHKIQDKSHHTSKYRAGLISLLL